MSSTCFTTPKTAARGADAQCERERRGGGESRALAQRAQRESEVAQPIEEPVRATLVAHVVLVPFDPAEIALARRRASARTCPRRVAPRLHLEMELDLFLHLGVLMSAAE